jgi:hypothetical protein
MDPFTKQVARFVSQRRDAVSIPAVLHSKIMRRVSLERVPAKHRSWTFQLATSLAIVLFATIAFALARVTSAERNPVSPSSGASGIVGEVLVAGGPAPANQTQGQIVTLTVSASGKLVMSRRVGSGSTIRLTLAPGQYTISALDAGACSSTHLQVRAGRFTSFRVVCSIR